jgi:L-asparagine transporter-like permease
MQGYRGSTDRRRKPDGIIKLVTLTSTIGWIMIILCSMLIIYAKPEQTNMFFKMFNIHTRDYWNYSLLNIVLMLLTFLLILSLIGILMNALRHRRKTDRINKSLIFQAFMSVFGIIILLINSLI